MYKPTRPDTIDEMITKFTKEKLPHFFKYAKDKGDNQISDVNESLVNKLDKLIPNPRLRFKKLGLGEIDYTLMMNNPYIEFDVAFTCTGRIIEEETDPIIVKYCEFDREYYFSVDAMISNEAPQNTDRYMRTLLKHRQISDMIKDELSKFGRSDEEITDILVKFLYGIKKTKNKTALWLCYGDIIVSNLERYFKPQTKCIQCIDCGEWFDVDIFDSATERCFDCAKEHKRELARMRKRRQREKERMSRDPLNETNNL